MPQKVVKCPIVRRRRTNKLIISNNFNSPTVNYTKEGEFLGARGERPANRAKRAKRGPAERQLNNK